MLVLTRKAQEQIQIGGNIVVTILQVKGQSVRVGIEAPRDVRVIRSELNATVETETREVASAPVNDPPRRRPNTKSQRLTQQFDRFFPLGYAPEQPAHDNHRDGAGLRRHVKRVTRKLDVAVDGASTDELCYAGVAI